MPQIKPGEGGYRALFEGAPVAIWEEDFSDVHAYLQEVTRQGTTDIRQWLWASNANVQECIRRIRILHVNKLAREYYGAITEQDVINQWQDLFDDPALEIFRNEILAFYEGNTTFEAEFSAGRLDGSAGFVRMNVSILPTPEENWSRVIVAFTDLTERHALESALEQSRRDLQAYAESLRLSNIRLRQINQDLEQFAYAAAHDFREPLRTISLYAQLLGRKHSLNSEGPAGNALQVILDNAYRMETLVYDLLMFARAIDNPDQNSKSVESREAVLQAIEALGAAMEEASPQLEIGALPPVKARSSHLRQVFQNLISNALKYRDPERKLRIEIAAVCRDHVVQFSVRDNGIGIKPVYFERIFGIFRRLHGREIEGNGIGLALCRKIVQQYQGSIWVESERGEGSTFYFTLPAADVEDML